MARLLRVSSAAAGLALVLMMLVTVIDVLSANLLHRPIIGVFDFVEAMLVLVVFLGLPATFRDDTHIAVDVIDLFVEPRNVQRLRLAAKLLTVTFLCFLAWQMITPAMDAYRFGERKQELNLPLFVLWIPMIVGISVSALIALFSLRNGEKPPPDQGE